MANPKLLSCSMLLVSLIAVNYPISVESQGIPKSGLFPFGDSNYDVGNKRFLTKGMVAANTWPYGKSRDDPSGRWSDGRIIPDFVGDFFGIPNPIPPVLQPDADVSRGAGFAVADATVLGAPNAETMTLSQQVLKFRQEKGKWDSKFLAESMFLFYIGADDYLNFTKFNPKADASAQDAFVTSVIDKLTNDLRLLYGLGARKFAFQTLAPLGCLPIVKQDNKLGDECLSELNNVVEKHNAKIRPMLEGLSKLLSGFQYTVFDFYGATMRRLTSRFNYRFFMTKNACCGIGSNNAFGCGRQNVHSNLCEYQRSHLFFDGRHNTEKANEAFAHLFFGADPNVVGPMNLRELIVYPVNSSMLEA